MRVTVEPAGFPAWSFTALDVWQTVVTEPITGHMHHEIVFWCDKMHPVDPISVRLARAVLAGDLDTAKRLAANIV